MQELQIINNKNPWPKGWGQKTSIMGVINLTPDSFSDGGDLNSSKKVLDQVNHFLRNGVDVIDLGAQSTRPGAEEVGSTIEIKRLIPYLKIIKSEYPDVLISILDPISSAPGLVLWAPRSITSTPLDKK